MSFSELSRIDKLKGSINHESWSQKIKMILILQDLWDVIEDTQTIKLILSKGETLWDPDDTQYIKSWSKSNNKAKAYILLSVSDSILAHVKNIEEAAHIWKKLEDLYAQKGFTSWFMAYKALTTTTLQKCKNISNYVNELQKHSQRLLDLGEGVSQRTLISLLLHNLGTSYENFVTMTLSITSENNLNFEAIVESLLDQERRKSTEIRESPVAMLHQKKPFKKPQKFNLPCGHCQKKGHKEDFCWIKFPDKKPKFSKNENSSREQEYHPVSFSVVTCNFANNSGDWHIDSGCTDHMCKNLDLFTSIEKTSQKIFLGDGQEIQAK